MDRSLKNRLLLGPIMLIGLFGVITLDHYTQLWTQPLTSGGIKGIGILLMLWIVLPLAGLELARLFDAENVRPSLFISISGTTLLTFHGFLTQFQFFDRYATASLAFIVVAVMLITALRLGLRGQTQEAIHHMAGTVLATLYLGGLAWFFIALRVIETSALEGSTALVLMILLVVKFTDIGAFFGGKLLGRNKLAPVLSPGKTWEGLLCGLIFAGAVAAICAPWVLHVRINWAVIFGILLGAVGQAGDLLESLIKRDANVKDAGHVIPGFGGILDVIDSPLLAAPVAYLLFSATWPQ